MPILDEVEKALKQFPDVARDREELERLQKFFDEVKKAGVATIRTYDLPLPDTIGKGATEMLRKAR